jgi:hypothetical protein
MKIVALEPAADYGSGSTTSLIAAERRGAIWGDNENAVATEGAAA